jgi:hypothetical protein
MKAVVVSFHRFAELLGMAGSHLQVLGFIHLVVLRQSKRRDQHEKQNKGSFHPFPPDGLGGEATSKIKMVAE